MPRKAVTEGGKRDELLAVALELFLENGYEATSVRKISQKAGCEVGLVYYYFKTKEELFELALSVFYENTEEEMRALSEQKDASVEKFVEYLEKKAEEFRKAFANSVHLSVRAMVREKIASFAETYLTAILEKPRKKDKKNVAVFLARGICSSVFQEDPTYYQENKEALLRICKAIADIEDKEIKETREVAPQKREIPSFLL